MVAWLDRPTDQPVPGTLFAGTLALLVGAIGSAVTTASSQGVVAAVLAGVTLLLWAGIRLFVLALVSDDVSGPPRARLLTAWGWSLLPFAMAFTPVLHAVAFAASAVVAWSVLERLGASRRSALRLVAWAYGFQIVVALTVWLTRNLLLAARVVLGG